MFPEWRERLRISPVQDLLQVLLVTLKDATKTGENIVIGQCFLPLSELLDQQSHTVWIPLEPARGMHVTSQLHSPPLSHSFFFLVIFTFSFIAKSSEVISFSPSCVSLTIIAPTLYCHRTPLPFPFLNSSKNYQIISSLLLQRFFLQISENLPELGLN